MTEGKDRVVGSGATGLLDGRVVLITGASSGIGARTARVVAAAGAAVVLRARRMDRLEALRDAIAADHGRALAVEMDVTDEPSVAAAFDAGESAFGQIDGVVANAGLSVEGRTLDLAVEEFDRLFAVNVRGVFLTAREGARRMRGSGFGKRGRIVLLSSITARMVTPGVVAYSASKAAVSHLTRLLAREWARSGPNVNALAPGDIRSEMVADWFESDAGKRHMATWPRGRLLEEHALDDLMIHLLSDRSAGITGSEFTVDDGQSL